MTMLEGRTHPQHPEREIPIGETANLLAALGNNETKAIEFLLAEGESGSTTNDIKRRLMAAQGEPTVLSPRPEHIAKAFKRSLTRAGLVTEIAPNQYARTPYGENIGVPFAGLMLSLSERYPKLSLEQIWTHTHDVVHGKIPQLIRLKIFIALLQFSRPIKQQDIVNATGEELSVVAHHLDELFQNHLIMKGSTEVDSPYRHFYATNREPDFTHSELGEWYKKHRVLAQQAYNLLLDRPGPWTENELADVLFEPAKNKRHRIFQLRRLGSALAYLKQLNSVRTEDIRGDVYLTTDQRAFIANNINLLHGFQKQDPLLLDEGRKKAEEILADPRRISQLLQKRRETSGKSDPISKEETETQIVLVLKNQRTIGITARRIKRALESRFGRKINRKRITILLNDLQKKGITQIVETKTGYYWRLTSTGANLLPEMKYYQYNRNFFERRRQIANLWRKRKYAEALHRTGIGDAENIYTLLQQDNPRLSYEQIGNLLGKHRQWIDDVVGRFKELGIPLVRKPFHLST